jgi:hypothetical protein
VIKEARVLDPLEPLTAQIQRRMGITAEEIDTVILRYVLVFHHLPQL